MFLQSDLEQVRYINTKYQLLFTLKRDEETPKAAIRSLRLVPRYGGWLSPQAGRADLGPLKSEHW